MLTRIALIAVLSFLGMLWRASIAQTQGRHYVTIFAYQSDPKQPKTSHTFAVFTCATGDRNSKEEKIENHTISWLPTSLDVDITKFEPEQGTNLDLPTTLKLASTQELRVSTWGPFRIKKELFDLALQRVEQLKLRKLKFIVLDGLLADRSVAVNCIHALSDLDPMKPGLNTGAAHGEAASKLVVEHLRPSFLTSKEDTAWLRNLLGLQKFAAGT